MSTHATTSRPLCGRPTSSGRPCHAVPRYSGALERYAPACRKHLTPDQRAEIDNDPLWTTDGQIAWYLSQLDADAEPLRVEHVAARLRLSQNQTLHALRRLEEDGRAASWQAGRHTWWGSAAMLQHRQAKRAADAKAAAEADTRTVEAFRTRNTALQALAGELSDALGDHDIGVSTLSHMTPGLSFERRRDQILLVVEDLDEAAWLLQRVTDDTP